ncbi:19747_t:CDS:2 [Funneliformis geosporum]|nr:19747_t:CDS:2 [Funneliformis geosporum]
MDNIFDSTSSIFDNLNLHVKPMDSSIKNGMNTRRGQQQNFQRSRETSKTNNIEGKWSLDHCSNPIKRSLLLVYDQSKLPKEERNKEKSRKLSKTSGSTLPGKLQTRKISSTLHLVHRLQPTGNTREKLGVQKLLGDECLDMFMLVEIRSPNQVSNNNNIRQDNKGSIQKLQSYSELVDRLKDDCEFHEFYEPVDKRLIDQENRKFFSKEYGITPIHPLLVDHSRSVLLFLDDRGIIFMWSESESEMCILEINKLEGLANYLYHSNKICVIIEDTGELIPKVELKRRETEEFEKKKLEKKKLAEKNREKRLAKKKRLAEAKEKRLTEEKRFAEKQK